MSKVILIADDTPANVKLMHVIFRRKGYTTLEASDGKQAVELAKAKKPDIIIMDKTMPVMDGLEATQILKADADTKNIPIICITSSAMKGDREKIIQAGCDDYMSKPVDINEVLNKVAEMLETGK